MTPPLIAIVGSYNPKRTEELSLKNLDVATEAGVELGRELARQGCHVVVYASYPYLTEVDVVRGYTEVKKTQPEVECIQVRFSLNYERPSFPEEKENRPLFSFKPDTNPEWEVSFYRSLREVDGMLIVGGGPSAMIAGVVAMGYRKPIVACASFGGYAKKIWGLLPVQQDLLTAREIDLMAQEWTSDLAKRYVEILLRQREQLAHEEQEQQEKLALREAELREQIATKNAEMEERLTRQETTLRAEFNQQLQAAINRERDNSRTVKHYSVISVLFFMLALAPWVIALGFEETIQKIWLIIFLAVTPLAAGVSAATIRVVFDAVRDTQEQTTQGAPSVIAKSAMGLVGGGITAVLYIITQLVAIGDAVATKHYVRLIPFALATGFLAGFALDVVERKLREKAESGVSTAYPNAKP